MTHPTTNERLAELRAVTTIEDGWEDYWHSLYNEYRSGVVRIGDLRSLLARLDAAEELLREVANSGVSFDDERLKCVELQIGRDTLAQCRSYLR